MTTFHAFLLAVITLSLVFGCQTRREKRQWSSTDSLRIVQENLAHRAEVDSFFRYDSQSPFHRDTSVTYEGVRWFPPDPGYYFQSRLHRYADAETVIVMGTHGEERRHLRYGYFLLHMGDRDIRLNVYKFIPSSPKQTTRYRDHLNVWFTDQTTGDETYEVGRYLDVGNESPDRGFVYTVDLNKAYNPYCAYSALYSCAIPRREDHLDVAIRAGEMKYHDYGTQTTLQHH